MQRILVNFVEAHAVGHAVEALRVAQGHAAAAPDAHLALLLNRATAWELAEHVDFVDQVLTVPMTGSDDELEDALADLPRDWDVVLDNLRRHQPAHADAVPGFARWYERSDAWLRAGTRLPAGVALDEGPGYVPHQRLRLDLPDEVRGRARARLDGSRPTVALLPAGSMERWLYPSVDGWRHVVEGLRERFHELRLVLVGRLGSGERTRTSIDREEHRALLEVCGDDVVDAFDLPLLEQLALVEASDALLSTHSGFAMASLAVGTPWACISGGRWPEWFFNDVPFRSVLPDPDRFGGYALYEPLVPVHDPDGNPRAPHVTDERLRADRGRIVGAVAELVEGTLDVEQAMGEHFRDLARLLGDRRVHTFTFDAVHERHLGPAT